MYCNQCGFNVGEDARFCPACGSAVNQQRGNKNIGQPLNPPADSINTYFDNTPKPGDEGSAFWWGVLCVIVPPILGFILFFVWREKYPRRAKVCLWCAIVSLILNIFLAPYYEELGLIRLFESVCLRR